MDAMTIQLAQTTLALVGVIAVILLLMFVLKRTPLAQVSKNNMIKILAQYSVSSKEKLLFIEINKQRLLIGASMHNICTLHVFDKKQIDQPVNKEHIL